MSKKILVVDDEESICEILKFNLEKEGYEVETANSAEDVLQMNLYGVDLMILDIMMERLSGFDLAKRLRNNPMTEGIPVIFCSALTGEDEKVMGLNMGADDYITKPFNIPEVIARVRAVLRRTRAQQPQIHQPAPRAFNEPDIIYRTLRIDNNEKVLYINNQLVKLTATEFKLIRFFLTHRGRIYSRSEIITNVWDGRSVTDRVVDTNITRLRTKIGEYGDCITSRTGFGYGFTEKD